MATYLDRILAAHRAAAADDPRPIESLIDQARHAAAAPARPFTDRIATESAGGEGRGRLAVIAEVKRRSPSKGDIDAGLDPTVLAKAYAEGGATCLSVLTDGEFFGGSETDLADARAAVDLPVLRKDFTVSEADVCDARLMGADAVLLIAAALDDGELSAFAALAGELGLDSLVEVHDEAELERAVAVGARLIGVNQRDLVTFEVDTNRAVRVAAAMPAGIVKVAESGVQNGDDVRALRDAGFDAVLVGEALVRSGDPAGAVGALRCS